MEEQQGTSELGTMIVLATLEQPLSLLLCPGWFFEALVGRNQRKENNKSVYQTTTSKCITVRCIWVWFEGAVYRKLSVQPGCKHADKSVV